LQLVLILCTFAIGGSLTGFVAKKIMNLLLIQADWLWAIIYIFLLTVIWPMMVLLVSIPFGQFRFFSNYTRKLGEKLGIMRDQKSGVGGRKSEVGSQKSGAGSQEPEVRSRKSEVGGQKRETRH